MHIPMTDQARDALITISVLWVVFAIVVGLRWFGRFRGAGIGVDDVLSLVALVRCKLAATRRFQRLTVRTITVIVINHHRDERRR